METRAHRSCILWMGVAALLSCGVIPARAAGEHRTVEVESLKITIDSEWASRTAPGYLPVRFDVTNLGDGRVIEIIGQGMRFFRSGRGSPPAPSVVRQALRLARGDRVRLTIPVPIFADNENIRFEIREDGRLLEGFSYSGFQSGIFPSNASALIVADPSTELARLASFWVRTTVAGNPGTIITTVPRGSGTSVTMPGTALPSLDFVLEPARVPASWLGFTSLRAVAIGQREWEQLNEDQQGALLSWTACGGDLLFVDGDLNPLLRAAQIPPAASDQRVRGYFFGRIHAVSSKEISAAGLRTVLTAAEKAQDSNWALPANSARDWGTVAARGFRLPIPDVGGVPARAYVTILIVFSLLIGPINYWILWRNRRQVLFVLTAPAISAVFIVLLAGYVIAGEGIGVRARAVTFTMLDQVRKQAATRGSVSLYAAGMTPAGGVRFGRDVAVYPIGTDGHGAREAQLVDLTDGQRFTGLVQARSPANFEQIAFRTVRERLTFAREAGGVTVVNGLGATISTLVFRAGSTMYSLEAPLVPGGKALLKAGAFDAAGVVPPDLPLTSRFRHLFDNQPDRSYLAVLDRSPFWDPGVSGAAERGSFHLVIGWPEGQP